MMNLVRFMSASCPIQRRQDRLDAAAEWARLGSAP